MATQRDEWSAAEACGSSVPQDWAAAFAAGPQPAFRRDATDELPEAALPRQPDSAAPDAQTLLRMLDTCARQRRERLDELDRVRAQVTDFEELSATLLELPEKVERKMLVPLGKLALFPGMIKHTNEVMVLLGDNYFALRSAQQAAEIATRRAAYVKPQVALLEGELDELDSQIKSIRTFGESQGAADGAFEIREPYDEHDELHGGFGRHEEGMAGEPSGDEDEGYRLGTGRSDGLGEGEERAARAEAFTVFDAEDEDSPDSDDDSIEAREEGRDEDEWSGPEDEEDDGPMLTEQEAAEKLMRRMIQTQEKAVRDSHERMLKAEDGLEQSVRTAEKEVVEQKYAEFEKQKAEKVQEAMEQMGMSPLAAAHAGIVPAESVRGRESVDAAGRKTVSFGDSAGGARREPAPAPAPAQQSQPRARAAPSGAASTSAKRSGGADAAGGGFSGKVVERAPPPGSPAGPENVVDLLAASGYDPDDVSHDPSADPKKDASKRGAAGKAGATGKKGDKKGDAEAAAAAAAAAAERDARREAEAMENEITMKEVRGRAAELRQVRAARSVAPAGGAAADKQPEPPPGEAPMSRFKANRLAGRR